MSVQHRNLAEIWTTLEGRHDIANILREIIGQHSIDSTLQGDESGSAASCIQKIIWIKTIFDLQRCYLSGLQGGVAECPPYVSSCLLPSELLLSTLLYLVNVKTRLFPSQTTLMTREFIRPRHILAQTILSGLRLVLLRKETVAAHDTRRLQSAINAAWQNDRLHGVERFIVLELYAEVLNFVSQESRENDHGNPYITEWSNARLPTFAAGLYPLDIRPEMFVQPLIHGTMEEDWIDAYWVLFDCIWAVECAVTQRYVDLRRQTSVFGSNQIGASADETLELLYQSRTNLIVSIFNVTGPMMPPSSLLDSLAATLLDWNEDLDNFLSRQDSLLQQRSSVRPPPSRSHSYGKHVLEMSSYLESAMKSFSEWLFTRKSNYEQFSIRKAGITTEDMQEMVKEWISRMTSSNGETLTRALEGSCLPVYIVDCPKLHVIPKKFLEYKLRWSDKWAYENLQESSPIINWKEGVQCPSCISGEKIKFARLIEPFQQLATVLDTLHFDNHSLYQYSIGDSSSYDATSASLNSRAASDAESAVMSLPSQSTMALSLPSHLSCPDNDAYTPSQRSGQSPGYSESPSSPTSFSPVTQRSQSLASSHIDYPVSPLNESLNIPIPVFSRMSVELPIPVNTPELVSASAPSDISSTRLHTPSTDSTRSAAGAAKQKSSSRTVRIANSIRRKSSSKDKETVPLPKEPSFIFSSSGHSLLLWGKGANHVVRFDIPSNDTSAIQGCKYEVPDVEAAAAGNHKCAIVADIGLQEHRLVLFDGMKLAPEAEVNIEFHGRIVDICIAVSRNDKYVAVSINDQIQVYSLGNGVRLMQFHHQIHVYEVRGGTSHKRTIPIGRTTSDESITESHRSETGWFGVHSKGLSSKEAAEEQRRQAAIVSRKLSFSTDSKRLVVATQLGDHCVYVDVWDCTKEPISTISEHARSFKLPPWTLNDGDLTSVFYDSMRRCAIVTAFLGKEYPILIPFPGYDALQNETYSTKAVHAAQSPSGMSFIVANAMTEIIQFEYTAKGTLSPRKLKKSSGKISNSMFKPGAIALAMPLENVLQCFWVKDGKCMLRSVKIGTSETFRDYDIRPHYDRLMSLKNKPVIARAPSLMIPEMDGT